MAQRFAESRFAQISNPVAPYVHSNGGDEWVLPVSWIATVPKSQAVWRKGMFANQNSGARLRNSFTLGILHQAFPGIDD